MLAAIDVSGVVPPLAGVYRCPPGPGDFSPGGPGDPEHPFLRFLVPQVEVLYGFTPLYGPFWPPGSRVIDERHTPLTRENTNATFQSPIQHVQHFDAFDFDTFNISRFTAPK